MSHATYNAMWREAQQRLRQLTAADLRLQRRPRETDKRACLGWVLRLYADYVRIVRTLDECHDQLVQPQKRELVRKLLDGCIGRLLELKHELYTELDKSNFHYIDDLLIERRLTYEDLEIPSPRYYYRENEPQLQQRREFIDRVLAKMAEEEARAARQPVVAVDSAAADLADRASERSAEASAGPRPGRRKWQLLAEQHESDQQRQQEAPERRALREATMLLQTHERARQNRVHSFNRRRMMEQRYQPPAARKDRDRGRPPDEAQQRAAVEIQRRYRGYLGRRRVAKYLEKEDTLIGLLMPRVVDFSYRDRIEEVRALRRALRRDLQAAYEATVIRERDWVDRMLSPDIFDDVGDEMREWVRAWYYDVRRLPKYPGERERKLAGALLGLPRAAPKDSFPEVDPVLPGIPPRKLGGSNLVTAGFWCSSTEYKETAEKLARSKKARNKGQKKKPTKEEKAAQRLKRREARKAEKQRRLADKLRGFQLDESAVLPALGVAECEYRVDWEVARPYDENPSEEPYIDLIRREEVHAKQFEMRLAIDELMRLELERLKDAEWREKNKRRKKKRRRKGKKKRKKGKKRRKGKRKKKDPTGDKTTEELLETLVRAGVVRNSPVAHMEEFFGEPSYCNFELRERLKDPLPALGDIRQVVREFCILPLGSRRAHELAPLVKSVLVAGPARSGKSLLADIVCTETGALRVDLTPEAVARARECFPDKKQWKLFLHMVGKVARLLAPTVIVMEDAHRNYYKKVPKPERPLKPKKFARTLRKLVKGIKRPDQILVLGTSNAPWLARGRRLIKAYQRHIFVPPPDYGSRSLLWHKLIMAHHGVDRNFEVTPLAHVTEWLPVPAIREAVERTLNVERRLSLAFRPLQHQEILTLLLEHPSTPTPKERAKWLKWWSRTPIQRKRAKVLAEWQKAADSKSRRRR